MTPRILAFADSLRGESFNKKLVPIGSLADPRQQAGIEALGKTLASFLMKLRA